MTDTAVRTTGVDPSRRRLHFYRRAAKVAVEELARERESSRPGNPSRAWTDDLEEIARRAYATHRQWRDAGEGKDGRTPGNRGGVGGDEPRAVLRVLSFSESTSRPAAGVDTRGPAEDGPEDLWPKKASA